MSTFKIYILLLGKNNVPALFLTFLVIIGAMIPNQRSSWGLVRTTTLNQGHHLCFLEGKKYILRKAKRRVSHRSVKPANMKKNRPILKSSGDETFMVCAGYADDLYPVIPIYSTGDHHHPIRSWHKNVQWGSAVCRSNLYSTIQWQVKIPFS